MRKLSPLAQLRKLSLLAQFSILSLVLFVVIGAVLGSMLTSYFETQEINRQKFALAALLEPAIGNFLDDDVLAHGATGKKYGDIDYALTFLGGVGLERIKIWNDAGLIVFSDD